MKKNNILGLTVAIITASMIFIGCQNTETSSGDSTGSSNGSTVTESSMSDDDNDVQSISGTISDIRDMQFVLEVDDKAYLFSYDSKPEDLDNIKDGDKVKVNYTGELSDVDAFTGSIISIEKE